MIMAPFASLGQSAESAANLPRVRVYTTAGNFVIELNRERAPITVDVFLGYVKQGFYNGTIFHRVIPGFIAQAGGYTADFKQKPVKTTVVNESGNGLTNLRGTVGFARTNEPHSGTSQFYINLADNVDLNPRPTRWGYAVFGKIVDDKEKDDGMRVVDEIGHRPTGAGGPFDKNVPVDPSRSKRSSSFTNPYAAVTTLFISDLHLDAGEPETIRRFVSFVETEARSARALYILGDLFEAWVGDDEDDPRLAPVQAALADLTRAGVPCSLMHGNRDFLIGPRFCAATGCRLLGDYERVDLYGSTVLLTHGDLLCTDDTRYMSLRGTLRNPAWQRDFLVKPLAERRKIAADLRQLSAAEIAAKSYDIMDVNKTTVESDDARARCLAAPSRPHTPPRDPSLRARRAAGGADRSRRLARASEHRPLGRARLSPRNARLALVRRRRTTGAGNARRMSTLTSSARLLRRANAAAPVECGSRDTPEDRPWGSVAHIPVRSGLGKDIRRALPAWRTRRRTRASRACRPRSAGGLESGEELARGLVTREPLHRERPIEDRLQVRQRARQARTRRVRVAVDHAHRRARRERPLARQHLVEHATQAIDVGAWIRRLGVALLGAHVVRRAEDLSRSG